MLEVNKENFEQEVVQHAGAVAVDWWSPKCEPCKELLPDVERLAGVYADKIKFVKVDVLANRRLALGYKVLGLPTFLFFVNGEKVAELAGPEACTPDAIETELKKLV